ncbi:MAG: helix-turn-helix domain-containing protein [Lachnospiraceae bacterium]|nr:helix-turn-helix domain-containing protein [Lachnospiraceae bacterium]
MNILTIEDLKNTLKLSDKQANALMRNEDFPSVKIGREYRVEEQALLEWMQKTKEVKLRY